MCLVDIRWGRQVTPLGIMLRTIQMGDPSIIHSTSVFEMLCNEKTV